MNGCTGVNSSGINQLTNLPKLKNLKVKGVLLTVDSIMIK